MVAGIRRYATEMARQAEATQKWLWSGVLPNPDHDVEFEVSEIVVVPSEVFHPGCLATFRLLANGG